MDNNLFTNTRILEWLRYFSENSEVDLEKVKLLDITRKNKNLIPMVESHSAVLVFTEAGHPDIFYRMFNAGLGECTVVYNEGSEPEGPILSKKVYDMLSRLLSYVSLSHMGVDRSGFTCLEDIRQTVVDLFRVLHGEVAATEAVNNVDHFRTMFQIDTSGSGLREERTATGAEAFALVQNSDCFTILERLGKLLARERAENADLDQADAASL